MHETARGALAGSGVPLRIKRHGMRWQVAESRYASSGSVCADRLWGAATHEAAQSVLTVSGVPLRFKRHGMCLQVVGCGYA